MLIAFTQRGSKVLLLILNGPTLNLFYFEVVGKYFQAYHLFLQILSLFGQY